MKLDNVRASDNVVHDIAKPVRYEVADAFLDGMAHQYYVISRTKYKSIQNSVREAETYLKLMSRRYGVKYDHIYGTFLNVGDWRISYTVSVRERNRFLEAYEALFKEVDKMDAEIKKKKDSEREAYVDKINADADAYIERTRNGGKADMKRSGPKEGDSNNGGIPGPVIGIGFAALAVALIASFNS